MEQQKIKLKIVKVYTNDDKIRNTRSVNIKEKMAKIILVNKKYLRIASIHPKILKAEYLILEQIYSHPHPIILHSRSRSQKNITIKHNPTHQQITKIKI